MQKLCCKKLPSCWASTVRLFVTSDESMRSKRRLVLGIVVLLLVNIIWVGSAELSDYIFHNEGFNKPFFTTYFKTSAFVIYLVGFIFYHPWQYQCYHSFSNRVVVRRNPPSRAVRGDTRNCSINSAIQENNSLLSSPTSSRSASPATGPRQYLGDSVFEPVTDEEISQDNLIEDSSCRHVHFNSVREVRHLQADSDSSAQLARMSHEATEQLTTIARRVEGKLSIKFVIKVALMFCILWFLATWGYQEALNDTSPAAVNILSSSSGLFTLLLASIFKSSSTDKFTISKFLAVLLSLCGIVMVTLSDAKSKQGGFNYGAIWALLSALLYACYIVLLKRKVPDETKMDITMFYGFVGALNIILLWPGFFILHYSGYERFELPHSLVIWGYLTLNALVGTVLSEFLWLWGCFLTSSLTATLSLSLVIPLTMLVDVFMKRVHFSWLFLIGTIPVLGSFFAVGVLTHYPDWDPVLNLFKKCCATCHAPGPHVTRIDGEQTERLLNQEESTDNPIPT